MNRKHDRGENLATEVRQALINAGTAPHDLAPLPGQRERGEDLLAAITQTPRENEATVRPGRLDERQRRRVWRRAGVLVAAAAVLAVTLVIVRPGRGPDRAEALTPALLQFQSIKPGTLPASGRPAQSVLEGLATKAKRLPVTAGPIQRVVLDSWLTTTNETGEDPVSSELVTVKRESFFQPDGTFRAIEHRGAALDDQGRIKPETKPSQPAVSDESFASPNPGPGYAASLPTDPRSLSQLLEANHDPNACRQAPGSCLFADIIDLHQNYVVPPELTSALWDILAEQPTVTSLGSTHDRLNRDAIAFTTAGQDGTSQNLIFADPKTGAYLGEEVILTAPSTTYSFNPPAVISFSALVKSTRIAKSQLPPTK